MLKERKGDPTDMLFFLVIIFFLAISLVVVLYTTTQIADVIDNTALNQSAAYSSISSGINNLNLYSVQRGFTLIFALLIIGVLISSFLIDVHPAFIFLYIITIGITIFVAVYLSNSYALLVSNNLLSSFASNYSTITWVMQNSVKILVGVGALSMLIIFGKSITGRSGGDF